MIRRFGLLSVSAIALVSFGCGGGHTMTMDMGLDGISLPDMPHPDLGPRDGGPDMPHMGSDMGGCFTGRACDPTVGCNGSQQCQPERTYTNTIYLPDGGTTMQPGSIYPMGYCTNAVLGTTQALSGMAGACDPNAASDEPAMAGMDGCLACAKCIDLGSSDRTMMGAPHLVQCAQRCTPNSTDNGGCRPGYQCSASSKTCTFADCATDLDCQTYVEDTNHNMMCDASAAGGDHVLIDPLSGAHCNTATYRCERTGTAGATAGQHCTLDHECEANGRCLDECRFSDFHMGYCSKDDCDLPGNACAAGGKCQDVGNNFHLCLRPCEVNNEPMANVLGAAMGHGDTCDLGQACFYDDSSPVMTAGNGGCLPGEYNAVAANNVGHSCTMSSECYSPHGLGQCIFRSPGSACSLFGCAGFPDTANVCGTGNSCFSFTGGGSVCLHECTTPADCMANGAPANHACIQLTMASTTKYCWPACQMDSDCQSGHTCVGASATAAGQCM